jgi:hypothetical protein
MKTKPLHSVLVLLFALSSARSGAAVAKYAVTDLQAAYGADLQFQGMSKGGVLTANKDGLPIIVRVQNGVRTDTPVPIGNYAAYNNQGVSYNEVHGEIHVLTVDGTITPTGFQSPASYLEFGGQNRTGTIVGHVPENLTGFLPAGGFVYDPVNGGRVVEERDGTYVFNFERVNAGALVGIGLWKDTLRGGLFLWVDGQPAINLFDSSDSQALAINEAAQIVGRVGEDAFIWDKGVLTRPARYFVADPAHPGVTNQVITGAAAIDISETGLVVGASSVKSVPGFTRPASGVMGWIYTKEGGLQWMDDLIDPTLGYQITGGNTIADDGTIYATGYLIGSNIPHQFLLTPLPEPGTCVLMMFGMGTLLRRRRQVL